MTNLGKKSDRLFMDLALTQILIILDNISELERKLTLELDFRQAQRQAQEVEFREFMDQLWNALTSIRSRFHIDAILLNLIKGPENEKEKIQADAGGNSSRDSQELTPFSHATRRGLREHPYKE